MNTLLAKKKKGFTLIELIAVIAILGILAAIIIPKMIGYTDSARLAKEVAECKSILNQVEIYNSTASTQIVDTATLTTVLGTANTGDLSSLDSLKGTINDIVGQANELIVAADTIDDLQAAAADTKYSDLKTQLTK